jgi:hypothetical protein
MSAARVAVVSSILLLAGCAGGLRFDARTIEKRCGVSATVELDRQQAVCMARLAGLKETRRCPLAVGETTEGPPAFRVRETCSGLAVSISKADKSVVVVELGRVIARYNPESPAPAEEPEENE